MAHIFAQIEKDIIELMNKSLKYCKGGSSGVRQPMYQYRAATINHRLASLFHNSFRTQVRVSLSPIVLNEQMYVKIIYSVMKYKFLPFEKQW